MSAIGQTRHSQNSLRESNGRLVAKNKHTNESQGLWQSGHKGLQASAIAALFLILTVSKKVKADNRIAVRYALKGTVELYDAFSGLCAKTRGRTVNAAERYRLMAAEMKAAAQLQSDYYLRSEYESLASAYLVLADQEDANSHSGWWESANRKFNSK
jgi:hypothetical protein